MNRPQSIEHFRSNPSIPVLIVGAGANGVGVLWDLAQQGVDALLVDRGDFCSGTSAASGRVVHGGLRYLENGEFRLVREALRERNLLLKNAPHCVVPLPVAMPAFSWTKGLVHAARQFLGLRSKPGDRGALILHIGMSLYDAFSGRGAVPAHRYCSRKKALSERPGLNPSIKCSFVYYDARLKYPEQLCMEMIGDAQAAHAGAHALNYCPVVGVDGDSVVLEDGVTGERLSVKPQIVINAGGAWIDLVNQAMNRSSSFIGGTRGSHLIVDHPQLHALCREQMLFYVNEDARICVFYPIDDRVLVGTTDIPDAEPDRAVCTEAETDYLLAAVRRVLPELTIDRSHVVFTFSGVRPLPRMDAATPGQISRDHSMPVLPGGDEARFLVYSLVGGKWTIFRAFAEQVTDRVLSDLGRPRLCTTANTAIGGGHEYPSDRRAWIDRCSAETTVHSETIERLFERYGTLARDIALYIAEQPDAPLVHLSTYSQREVVYLATREKAVHLDDVILRRTMIGLLGRTTRPLLEEISQLLAPHLGWSDRQMHEEVERTVNLLRERHLVTFPAAAPHHSTESV